MNVILVTVDALRADHVGALGYGRNTTPTIDELCSRSLFFSQAISQSPHTPGSFPALFSSTYPLEYGGEGSISDRPLLVNALRDFGLSTLGIHSNPYLSGAYGYDSGFDRFEDSLGWSGNKLAVYLKRAVNHVFKTRPYLTAAETTEKAISWLEDVGGKQDFFLWAHYMDPHGPYQPPPDGDRRFLDCDIAPREAKKLWRRTVDSPESIGQAELELLVDLYDEEIAYVDRSLGRLWDYLRAEGLDENTVLVLTSDHGEQFRDHGGFNHPRQLYDELIRVPLVVYSPDLPSGEKVEQQVRTIDLAPTVASIVGFDQDASWRGANLIDVLEGRVEGLDAISEATGEGEEEGTLRFSIRRPKWKYILSLPQEGEEQREVYRLEEDPREQRNLVEEGDVRDLEELLELDELLRGHIRELYDLFDDKNRNLKEKVRKELAEGQEACGTESPEVCSRLEDLGYLD